MAWEVLVRLMVLGTGAFQINSLARLLTGTRQVLKAAANGAPQDLMLDCDGLVYWRSWRQ